MNPSDSNQNLPNEPSLVSPPQANIASGSAVAPQELTNKSPQSKLLKYVLIAASILIVLPILAIIVMILSFAVDSQVKMTKLQTAADAKAQKLEQMLTPVNKNITAVGVVNGDGLTANSDPIESTHAELSFRNENKSMLSGIESGVDTALEKYGFAREGGDIAPYYQLSSPAYAGYPLEDGNRLVMRYANNSDALLITYQFDKYYDCPATYVCERTEDSKQIDKIYDIRAFATIPVTKVSIIYADKNYYLTQL